MLLIRGLAVLGALTLLLVPMAVVAQPVTPTPAPAPRAIDGAVVREFVPRNSPDSPMILLAFAVIALNEEALTAGEDSGIGGLGQDLGAELGQRVTRLEPTAADAISELNEVAVDTVGDWTFAQLSDSPGSGVDVGLLIFGDGPLIQIVFGAETGTDFLGTLENVAREWLEIREHAPTAGSGSSYQTDSLWAELPTPARLKSFGRFRVDREWILAEGSATDRIDQDSNVVEGSAGDSNDRDLNLVGGSAAESCVEAQPPTSSRGTRENPIPLCTPVSLSDGWTITVNSVHPDATASILAENTFNDPPEPGTQFFMVNISATYDGPGSDTFDGSLRLRAVGPTSVAYSTFENSCGVIPDELPQAEVFQGGTIEGNVCWAVKEEDAAALLMFDDPLFSENNERVFLSLTEDEP